MKNVIVLLLFFTVISCNNQQSNEDIESKISVIDNGYQFNDVLGGISNAQFTVVNNSNSSAYVRVAVNYLRKNGNTCKNEIVDVFVTANSQQTAAVPNSGCGKSVEYSIYKVTKN